MAGGVIYLDIDDEITSAASRIRTVEGRRVAVVLPHGSRVATSRINFRLLARDALTHEKRLSIVANDAATRALAASAGLSVFASVAEYEVSLGAERESDAPAKLPEGAGLAAAAEAARAAEAAQSAAAALAGETARIPTAPAPAEPTLDRPVQQTLDDMEAAELAAAAAAIRATAEARPRTPASPPSSAARAAPAERSIRDATAGTSIRDAGGRSLPREARTQDVPVRGGSITRSGGRPVARTPLLVGLGAIALAVLIGGVGAYLLLPSATIAVAPKEEPVGPVRVTILADPTATAPDTDAGVVPAQVLSVDASTTNTFPATGKRVVTTKAIGTVRFENRDPTASNTIASGSIVRTDDGIRFQTNAAVTVPRAELVFPKVLSRFATVKVTALDKGPDGNVGANRITQVPRDEDTKFLKVTNPDETTGGKREEFPKVTQKDIDAAMAALEPALQSALTERLADPSIAPAGATVFPETAELGAPVTLLDQEAATFELGLSASATVTAVDAGPVETIAAERLRAAIDPSHRLVDGSIDVTVEPAVIAGDQISFPASATATQVAILDPAELKTQVMGRPLDEARRILEAYGTVQLSAWPDWVTTVPTLDGRVQLTLDEAVAVESPPPTAAP